MNYYYIHVPKTGGRSISEHLNISWRGPMAAHSTANSIIENIGREAWDSALTIATVRNPYDRAVSLWASRNRLYSFEKWCEIEILKGPWNVQQNYWTHDKEGRCLVKLILKFENHSQWTTLPHIGKSDHKHWTTYYNEDLMNKINEAYAEDFKHFGYTKYDGTSFKHGNFLPTHLKIG